VGGGADSPGSAELLGADEGDHCAALALKVVTFQNEPRLWAEATKLMAEGCAWLTQNWSDDPDGKNADEALKYYRSAAAAYRTLGDLTMTGKMEKMTQKITQWPAYRKREDVRFVGSVFVMEVACFILAKEASDSFARAWTDVIRGQSYDDLIDYRRHHPWTARKNILPLAQTAVKTFVSAVKVLQMEKWRHVVPWARWAVALQGLAVSMHLRGWEGDMRNTPPPLHRFPQSSLAMHRKRR
jgi:hypothetical protein